MSKPLGRFFQILFVPQEVRTLSDAKSIKTVCYLKQQDQIMWNGFRKNRGLLAALKVCMWKNGTIKSQKI